MLESFTSQLTGYVVNKNTFVVPVDWQVDKDLILGMVQARLDELG